MAKYSDIKGFTVQTVSTDPVASQALGGSWSSGGSLNTARPAAGASSGNDGNSALFIMSGASNSNIVESYNGSAFTEIADLSEGADNAMSSSNGSSTATLFIGGNPSPARAGKTESWDGSSWTETGDLNTSRGQGAGTGISTASLVFGGVTTAYVGIVEQWDGSSWTEVADLNTTRANLAGMGLYTASIAAAGRAPASSPTIRGDVELWNGSSWTETTEVNTARAEVSGSGVPYTDVIVYGGEPSTANTEFWNGSSWTELNNLSSAGSRISQNMGASASATLAFQQASPGQTTEEWTAPSAFGKQIEGQLFFNSTANAFKETISDVPSATWASGTSINTSRQRLGGAGLQTANVVFAGAEPSMSNKTEEWNGSAWTEKNDINTARYGPFSFGVYNAAIAAAGYNGSTNVNSVESWDGTNWTEVAEVNSARRNSDGFGTSTDGLIAGGITVTANCETWNGSAWTEVADLNEGRGELATSGKGTTTAGIVFGGEEPSLSANTEEWNGSSWTELNNLNTARKELAGNGTATSALGYAGNTATPKRAFTEFWNGTSWTEVADLSTGKNTSAGVGASGLSAMNVAGDGPSVTNTVEEWTVNLSNKTITSS